MNLHKLEIGHYIKVKTRYYIILGQNKHYIILDTPDLDQEGITSEENINKKQNPTNDQQSL